MTIDLSSMPTHVTLTVGDRIVIPLPTYSGSGNTWSATAVRGQQVAHVLIELEKPAADLSPPGGGTHEPPALMLVPERAVVSGLTPGNAIWRLVLARPFGPPTSAATHDLQVTVVAVR